METLRTEKGVPDNLKRREVVREKARAKGRKAAREKLSPEARKRVSEKIEHLVKSGEVPNTPEGRARAAAIAHSMERAKRLRRGGKYVRKGKK